MKKVYELKVGNICYWFSEYGEFEGKVEVMSIKVDNDGDYFIRIKNQGIIHVISRIDVTYGNSIDFPSMMCFFSKEAAVKYFTEKLEKRMSILKKSIIDLFND